jgi:hypothetical protein
LEEHKQMVFLFQKFLIITIFNDFHIKFSFILYILPF